MAQERRTGGGSKRSGSTGSGSRAKKGSSGASGSRATKGSKAKSSTGSKATKGTAPSAADITELDRMEPSEEAKRHEPSPVDAMGQDKRRPVVGHSYGPSRRSQLMFFASAAAVLVIVVGGWFLLVALVDTTPSRFPDRAPWSQPASTPDLRAQQNAAPRPPDTPCGEPGNVYPVPNGSPCASTESKPTLSSGSK